MLTPHLFSQRLDLCFAARRHDGDFAAALVGNYDSQRLAVALKQRNMARLGTADGQIEQCPLISLKPRLLRRAQLNGESKGGGASPLVKGGV